MRFVQKGRAATLDLYLPRRPSAAGTFVVYTAAGSELQASSAASLDSVSTTLSAAADAGAASVTLTSATSVTAGRRYLLDGTEDTGGEMVTVRSVSGTTVTLAARLLRAHASGATFQGTRVTFAVSAITQSGRNHRVEYSYPEGDAQPSVTVPFDVVRYSVVTNLTAADLRTVDGQLAKKIPAGVWLPDVIASAWSTLQADVSVECDPGAIVGAVDLTTAHAHLCRFLLADATAGDDQEMQDARTRYAARYREELKRQLATLSRDEGQTGVATSRPYTSSVRVGRG
jgi:hypothetical protein